MPNIIKLKGMEDATNIESLTHNSKTISIPHKVKKIIMFSKST